MKSLLGDKYELARLQMRNPDGPPPKGGKAKPASKPKSAAKTPVKRKKRDDDDEEDDEPPPAKRGRKTAAKPKSKGKAKDEDVAEEDEPEEADEDEEMETEEAVGSGEKIVPELLLANKWDVESGPDPTGWWVSEKLDGVRCVMPFLSAFKVKLLKINFIALFMMEKGLLAVSEIRLRRRSGF